jgi:hypothetical protein
MGLGGSSWGRDLEGVVVTGSTTVQRRGRDKADGVGKGGVTPGTWGGLNDLGKKEKYTTEDTT